MRGRLRRTGDQGETLLELLVAITILGVCVIAIGAGVAGAVLVSGLHRDQADADRVLHNYAETLKAATYNPCSSGSAASYTLAAQSGFQAPALDVSYWNGSTFQGSCPASGDQGLQRVTIRVTNIDNRVGQSLTIVLRNPS